MWREEIIELRMNAEKKYEICSNKLFKKDEQTNLKKAFNEQIRALSKFRPIVNFGLF